MVEFGFEKLKVWQKAIDFADEVYDLTAAFPSDERFGLTSQMRRSAVSVSANIAEGASREPKDFARFLRIAHGSLMENISESRIATRRRFLPGDGEQRLRAEAYAISRMLSGLRKSLR